MTSPRLDNLLALAEFGWHQAGVQEFSVEGLLARAVDHARWVTAAPDLEEIWEGLLFRGCVHLLAAPPKRGKSTFLTHLLWHLSGPERIELDVAGQTFTLVDGKFLGRRFRGCQRILLVTENPAQFWTIRPILPGVTTLSAFAVRQAGPQAIPALIRCGRFDLVAVDCLDKALPLRDENSNSELAELLGPIADAAHEANVTTILTHHFRKRGGSGGEEIRGGTALFGAVDEYWSLGAAGREDDGGPMHVCLEPSGRLAPPQKLFFAMTLTDAWVDEQGERRAEDAVLAALEAAGEPRTRREIAAAAGVSDATAKRVLSRLVKRGRARAVGKGNSVRYEPVPQ